MVNTRAVLIAAIVGTVLQVAMVVAGHSNKSIAGLFAVGGMGLSLLAGLIYAFIARESGASLGNLAIGGAIAGGVCAFIGILVSHLMGDVPASLLLLGTVSSIVTGAIGGAIGKLFVRSIGVAVIMMSLLATPPTADAQTPPPTVGDFSWLAGRWEGSFDDKTPGNLDITFAPPVNGLITGMMRVASEGKILVVELISIVDTPNGPELRFRHFSPSLEAYETNFKQTFRLKNNSASVQEFENVDAYEKTLMSTQARTAVYRRVDSDTFVAHSDLIGSNGKPAAINVTYKRVR
jgi:Domain of unknown function (DUF6265)